MKKAALFLLSLIPFFAACDPAPLQEDVLFDSPDSGTKVDTMVLTRFETVSLLQRIATGILHTCMINPDASISCWGTNDENQAPARIDGAFTSVSAGGYHTCALRSDGNIACWGQNDNGESPAVVDGPFVSVSTGWHHACGLLKNGRIHCWGKNDDKQAPDMLIGPFITVSCGGYHTCALRTSGEAACWGYNDANQAPASIQGPFIAISAGWEHTCAIKTSSRTIKCWGFDSRGQAPGGINETFESISSGTLHTCGIKTDKTLKCWGWNGSGQTPVLNETFASVSCGQYHRCAIKKDGLLVKCFGQSDLLPTPPCSWAKNYNPLAFGVNIPENMCQPTSCLLTIAEHDDVSLNALIRHTSTTICIRIVKDISDPSIKTGLKMFGFDLLPDRTVKINGVAFDPPTPTATVYEDVTTNQLILNTPSDGFNYAEITPTTSTSFPYDDIRPLMWHFTQ
jgi:alpha-tubulin suppressor-like RCC1 family protein